MYLQIKTSFQSYSHITQSNAETRQLVLNYLYSRAGAKYEIRYL